MNRVIEKGKTPVIFHGHFYQPPRENPRTGIINKQLSAHPFSDWNQRIVAECYRANGNSRYLDSYGAILSLSNNYEILSFNFGPTLLSWLATYDPLTYELILEADKASIARLGHGNAIAQAYSHPILPLSSEADARTQILWGLDDFARRFGREAKGLWLSETAINGTVIDLLAEAGVEFVILSPWQGKAIATESGRFTSLAGKPAPYDRPFILTGEQGNEITAFFYNAPLAEGISFGHYLRDADELYRRLLTIKKREKPALIQTATDGEIYGHHEPFGDMALAALAKKIDLDDEFYFTNYAAYLAQNPATERAKLHPGEANRGTSWSCYHGVSRWYKDCGCHTGGDPKWNQKWRTPLRDTFDALAESIDSIYEKEVAKLLPNIPPADLLHAFAPVPSGLLSMRQFLSSYSTDSQVQDALAALLLGQLYKHYTFTSCGWFFNDIAGIEPRQNIVYALMAISYYQRYSSEELLSNLFATLAKAKANRPEDGTGKTIAVEELASLSGEAEACFFYTLQHQLPLRKQQREAQYGYFTLINCSEDGEVLEMEVENSLSLQRYRARVTELRRHHGAISYSVALEGEKTVVLEQEDIPLRMRDELFMRLEKSFCDLSLEHVEEVVASIHAFRSLTRNLPYLPMSTLHQELIGTALTALNSLANFSRAEEWCTVQSLFAELISFYLRYARLSDRDLVIPILEVYIGRAAKRIAKQGLKEELLTCIDEFVALIRSHALAVELRTLQEVLYPYLIGKKTWEGNQELLTALALDMNFSPELLTPTSVALVKQQRSVL